MHDETAVLDEVLHHHRVRDGILIGHSDGASIALIYAGRAQSGPLRALILEPHVSPSLLASRASPR
jgi:pimeloyl-ACP methyl ester carboxylesterase